MGSCKRYTSLLNNTRRFSTQSLFEGTLDGILATLHSHVIESGQSLFSILTNFLQQEREKEKERREALLKLVELKDQMLEVKAQLLESKDQLLELKDELLAIERIEVMRAWGLNDTRGLFEYIQEILIGKLNIKSRLKGADLWEAILKTDANLATCIEQCTKVPVTNVAKQALNCYNIYSILSQHVHDGKSLAELQVAQRGTIKFERGPLSSEQVKVLLCIGAAAQVGIQENTKLRTMYNNPLHK